MSPTSRPRLRRRTAALLGSGALVAAASALAAAPAFTAHAVGGADGAVSQVLVTTNPASGGNVLIVVTVTNNGPDDITEAIVPGSAPTGATLNTVTPSQGACAKGRNSVYTCNFGLVRAGASARATVSATLQQSGTLTSQASLQVLGASDPDLSNNVARISFDAAGPLVDVQMSGSTSTRSPAPGEQFDYRFQLKVSGKDAATDVVLTVDLPATAAFVSAGSNNTPVDCLPDGLVLRCTLGTMAGGANATVVVTVQAPLTVGTVMNATGRVTHAGGDLKPADDSLTLSAFTK